MVAEPQDPSLAAGTMVGGYRIEYALGAGGMGTVYAAVEPKIGKHVAIKVLRRVYADDARLAARFEREARAVNDIHHPGIIDIFAFGQLEDGRPYLVMSKLDGRSLRDLLDETPKLPKEEVWRICRAVAKALGAAHEAGVVHRDLKPDNVFMERRADEPAEPRLLDFGLAQMDESIDGDALAKLTQTGVPMGTPRYMAPEQWWCQPTSGQTDQYAFGVLLFEMLAGRAPFETSQYVELLQQHLHEAPPTLADVGAEASPLVERYVARLLAKSADDRFESIEELVAWGDAAFTGAEPPDASLEMPSSLERADTVLALDDVSEAAGLPKSRRGSAQTPATAKTNAAVADEPPKIEIPSGARPLRRFFLVTGAAVVLAFGALAAAGYAGTYRYSLGDVMAIAGWSSLVLPVLVPVTLLVIVITAWKRARSGRPSAVPWVLTLLTTLSGSLGTYTGWTLVNRATWAMPLNDRLITWNLGMYEANGARFLSLCASLPLLLALTAVPGISGMVDARYSRVGPVGASRGDLLAGVAGCVVLAAAGLALGAPSASVVAMTAAASFLIAMALPTVHVDTAPRDELERAGASVLAVGVAAAIAFARVESRQANAWSETLTRSERVAELTQAAAERSATTAIALIAALLVLVIEARRIRRLWQMGHPPRPRGATWALLGLILATVVADVAFHSDYVNQRARMRADLEAQFALFSALEPPVASSFDPEAFAPHFAPALQVTRDMIALNGEGLSPLAALEGAEGKDIVRRDILHAVGAAARMRRDGPMPEDGEAVELALTIDRSVPYRSFQELLTVARQSGVRRAELRLLREEPPALDEDAPPEARYVLPRDFVAVVVRLGEDGFRANGDATYGEALPPLLAAASDGEPVEMVASAE